MEIMVLARMKELCRASTITSPIYLGGGNQAPIFDVIYHERSL